MDHWLFPPIKEQGNHRSGEVGRRGSSADHHTKWLESHVVKGREDNFSLGEVLFRSKMNWFYVNRSDFQNKKATYKCYSSPFPTYLFYFLKQTKQKTPFWSAADIFPWSWTFHHTALSQPFWAAQVYSKLIFVPWINFKKRNNLLVSIISFLILQYGERGRITLFLEFVILFLLLIELLTMLSAWHSLCTFISKITDHLIVSICCDRNDRTDTVGREMNMHQTHAYKVLEFAYHK